MFNSVFLGYVDVNEAFHVTFECSQNVLKQVTFTNY